MILSKYIFTDVVQSAARFYRTPADLSRHGTDGTTPSDGKTNIGSARLESPFQIGVSTTVSPSRTGSQDIISPRGSIGPQWSRYAQPLDVGAGIVGEFATNYLTPSRRRIPMFGVNPINECVQWLGISAPLRTD